MVVRVLKRHIDKGAVDNCNRCPIALAIRERSGKSVSVRAYDVSVGDDEYVLPETASNFIFAFDSGKAVRPFKFTINVA